MEFTLMGTRGLKFCQLLPMLYSDVKMGAGRKTQTFILPPNANLAPYPVQARQLRSNHLGGVIFWCKSSTMMECLSKQLFGLPGPHFSYVKNISPSCWAWPNEY